MQFDTSCLAHISINFLQKSSVTGYLKLIKEKKKKIAKVKVVEAAAADDESEEELTGIQAVTETLLGG